jgi:hypothetical protein
MKPVSLDTPPEVQRIHFELLGRASAGQKLRSTFDLIQTLRRLTLADLRRQFQHASDDELRNRLIARLLPREDVIRAYGFDPESNDSRKPQS